MDRKLVSPLGVDSPQVRGQGVIMKATLNSAVKFWRMVVCSYLSLIVEKNLITQDGVALIARMVVGYNIDFAAIIIYEIHEQAFGEMNTLPFPFFVQLLCDEASITEIL